MRWEEVEIEDVLVDLPGGRVTLNHGAIILTVVDGRMRAMQLVYAVAYATKHPPVDKTFSGLTWGWLKANLVHAHKGHPLCRGDTARVVWNQECREPTSWRVSGVGLPSDDWLERGYEFLKRLFISEPLTDEQRYHARIARRAHRMHLPDRKHLAIVPEATSLPDLLTLMTPYEDQARSAVENDASCRARAPSKIAQALGTKVDDIHLDNDDSTGSYRETKHVSGTMKAHEDDITQDASKAVGEPNTSQRFQPVTLHGNSGLYSDSRAAIQKIAQAMPEVEEIVFIAYTAILYAGDLRALTSPWRIRRLRLLVRDMTVVDQHVPDEIPRDGDAIQRRQQEVAHTIRDLQARGQYVVEEPLEVRYYRGQPCLCGLLVRESGSPAYSAGFLSICRQRIPIGSPIDYSPMSSPILRLSRDNPYEMALLDSFASWFSFVWAEGSHPGNAHR